MNKHDKKSISIFCNDNYAIAHLESISRDLENMDNSYHSKKFIKQTGLAFDKLQEVIEILNDLNN
jgi:hypothetical protein